MEERRSRRLREARSPHVNMFRHLGLIFAIGAVLATFFTAFTPYGLTYGLGQGGYEPPADDPAYYLRFLKTFNRMGGTMKYLSADNRDFLLALYHELGKA